MSTRLNDLTGKEWLVHTKTVMLGDVSRSAVKAVEDAVEAGVTFSEAPPRDVLKKSHPATFSERDVGRLVRFFTRAGGLVLDPFMGVGSTALACLAEGRRFVGFELYPRWVDAAQRRLEAAGGSSRQAVPGTDGVGDAEHRIDLRCAEALEGMRAMPSESVDFIVTSPPYWRVLSKVDHKAERERVRRGLGTVYGSDKRDLANVVEYGVFLRALRSHFAEYSRLLKPRAYAAVVVSDFRHKKRHYLFHAHVAEQMEMAGFITQSVVNLVQDNKRLYPYGFPTTLVPNVSNQYIVICRKL